MRILKFWATLLSATLLEISSVAFTPGTLDPDFGSANMLDNAVYAILGQPDGKIVIAGAFTQVYGATRKGIARLEYDGTLDASFDAGNGPDIPGTVALALQPDGKILVGGPFTLFNGYQREHICRLNPDGSVDLSF